MIYGYIRVSTDKQNIDNQRFEIEQYCNTQHVYIDRWIEETISGKTDVDKRKLGSHLSRMKKGDILICAELSRLGRNLLMIMSILNDCLSREIQVWTIKDRYRLGNDINSKVLAFAFGLSAEIERELISQRTKEALARKKSEGIILGRPKGSKSNKRKLNGTDDTIIHLMSNGVSLCAIARIFQVNRLTVSSYIKERGLHPRHNHKLKEAYQR